MLNFLLLRQILEDLIECNCYQENDIVKRDDNVLEYSIKFKMFEKFQSYQVEDSFDMWYVAILPDKKGKKKYSGKELSSASPFAQPDIAILAASSCCIGLFRECPDKTLRIPMRELVRVDINMQPLLEEVSQTYKSMVDNLMKQSSSMKGRQKQKNRQEVNPSIKAAIEASVEIIWIKPLSDLTTAHVLEGKVSGVDLEFNSGNQPEFKGLSLSADFNSELILERLWNLKQEQDEEYDDEDYEGYDDRI